MPDIECWNQAAENQAAITFTHMAAFAIAASVIYAVIIPMFLLRRLRRASRNGLLTDPDFLEANGWLVLKYRPRCYWFEIVVLAYKVVWTGSSVLLDSAQNAWWLLGTQGSATFILLGIVWCERPFQDATTAADPDNNNDHEHAGWTSADVLQVLALLSL